MGICTVPYLASIFTEMLDEDLTVDVDHLKHLHNDMEIRFSDLLQVTVPQWLVDPFVVDSSEVDIDIQERFIKLQHNTAVQAMFKYGRFQKLCMNEEISKKYPLLWKNAKLFLLTFPSYLVESGFSRMIFLLSKTRNFLDVERRGDLRLSLTAL
ncbi:uncharacterized protein LOC115219961 [Octopus sinensis]|uniref:Uncharacterized protein LOC115219961 n=1 Tax=Octopus sinensis TaxID=2607531 RepID=A0A6P7T5I1_9MOLL|nr:uncharacterized protein LOC115219961 [Octopus sinensis]